MNSTEKTIRVLFVGWPGGGLQKLNTQAELKAIQEAIDRSRRKELLRLEALDEPTLGELESTLRRFQPHVLHISAHGAPNDRLFVRQETGYQALAGAGLAGIVQTATRSLRLVVLNACYSAGIAAVLREHAGAVVGNAVAVDEAAAQGFAAAFYGALGDGESLAQARSAGTARAMTLQPQLPGRYRAEHREDIEPAELVLVPEERPPAPTGGGGVSAPQRRVTRVVMVLDAYDTPFDMDGIRELIAQQPGECVYTQELWLSQEGVPRFSFQTPKAEMPWGDLQEAVRRLRARAKEVQARPGTTAQYIVCGKAPLPLFAQLGFELSRHHAELSYVHSHHDGRLECMPVSRAEQPHTRPYFDPTTGLDFHGTDKGGPVAVFVSHLKGKAGEPKTARTLIEAFREAVLPSASYVSIVEVVHSGQHTYNKEVAPLTAQNIVQIGVELSQVFSKISDRFRGQRELHVFVAGAAPLAFMVGQSVNPNMFHLVRFPEFAGGSYVPAVELPRPLYTPPPIPQTDAARLLRSETLRQLLRSIEGFRSTLEPGDLAPPRGLRLAEADRPGFAEDLLHRLGELALSDTPADPGYEYDPLEARMALGEPLLQALGTLPPEVLEIAGPLFVLHELLHVDQALVSANYWGIGRAGVVLEDVDWWADAFALAAWTRWAVRRGGPAAAARVCELATRAIDAHIAVMVAFDRLEHGTASPPPAERRTRRYLCWAIQRQRAATLRRPSQIDELYADRLVAQLAPLRLSLDPGGELRVHGTTPDTQLVLSLRGRLLRTPRSPQMEPDRVLQAIRELKPPDLVPPAKSVLFAGRTLLVPWA